MRALIQRVTKASVEVDGETISSIGRGLCVLVGISKHDTAEDADYIVKKLLQLRLFDDDSGKRWSKNVMDMSFEILCVSQFTLMHVLKGNKPDFHQAMGGEDSKAFYEEFLFKLGQSYSQDRIKDGRFGAMMSVNISNDGPVTLCLDSPTSKSNNKSDKIDE